MKRLPPHQNVAENQSQMTKLDIKDQNGEVVRTIEMPSSIEEVTLLQYITFASDQFGGEVLGEDHESAMIAAVANLCGIQEAEIMQYGIESIQNIYAYFSNVIANYTVPNAPYDIEYKGVMYNVPIDLIKGVKLKKMKAIDYLTVKEANRVADANLKAIEANYKSDRKKEDLQEFANNWFSQHLTLLAVLLKPVGQDTHLPLDPLERDEYINKQKAHFQDIDLKTGLDISFFLTNLMTSYLSIQTFVSALSYQYLLHMLTMTPMAPLLKKPKVTAR